MQVYLTGVNTIKKQKSISEEKSKSKFSPRKDQEKYEKEKDSIVLEENSSSETDKIGKRTSKVISNRTFQSLKKNLNSRYDHQEDKKINIKNNYISIDDKSKRNHSKKSFKCEKDFSIMRHKNYEQKKNNKIIEDELKEEYLEYIMLKEPKYADFDKISEDHRKKIYLSFQKYNNNLLIIAQKKEEHKKILSEIEKSLINNYYLKDSSMLPVYEELIEKVKIDILTKQQEYDGYHKIYEELYNHNYTIKRKVLDEIDIDRVNEDFYDQYKILKNHAIVQVSKKQESLNQVEEYQKKLLEEHEKEIKQKNKILKDLKLQIEVFKEDEKDLVNKLKKLKTKRENIIKTIKEKEKKNEIHNINYIQNIKRYQKSFISMNKIFKSVNAKNLEDVLYDVNYIKSKFNKLKNNIINLNLDISNLNSEYSSLDKNLIEIKKEIILTKDKNKKSTVLNQQDQKRSIEIKNELKKINENENRIKEITQNNIGTFQQGITFIFQKIKTLNNNIVFLRKSISPKLIDLINKYKNTPFSVNYEKIDKEFLINFNFLFFQFSNIIFYLSLRSMTSGLNINDLNNKRTISPIYNKVSLDLYQTGIKKALKEYNRRTALKHEKQKEINIKTKKKEIEQKIDDKLMKENKAITQNQMFTRFIDYLHNKDNINSSREKNSQNENTNANLNTNRNSIFFTGIDSIKYSKNSSINSKYSENSNKLGKTRNINNNGHSISLKQKEEFLQKNKNKIMNIFSKYQNSLVKEIDKNLYFQQKYIKKIPRTQSRDRFLKNSNYTKNNFINKRKIVKDVNSEQKNSMPNLIDENYEYDEDDEEDEKKNKIFFKKNKTYSNFSFFKLNKDRANIYKKMNDLGKLQMAYFGGRFLNTKINSGMNTTYGGNVFDEFVNNYYKRQNEHNNFNNKNNKRKLNLGKKLVDQISANQKLRKKKDIIIRNNKKKENNNILNIREKNKFRKRNADIKNSFSLYNKKSTMGSTNNKSMNHYKKIEYNNKTYSRNKNNYYRSISIRKNITKGDKSEISNYNSKK